MSWFRGSRRRRSETGSSAGAEQGEGARGGDGERHEDAAAVPAAMLAAVPESAPEPVPDAGGERAAPAVPAQELRGRPLADLHELARAAGIPRYRLLRRQALIAALSGEEAPAETPAGAAAEAEPVAVAPPPTAIPEPEQYAEPEAPAEPSELPEPEPEKEPEWEPEGQPEAEGISVSEVGEASRELVDALERLVRQLSSSAALPSAAELEEVASSRATRLLIARDEEGAVVGMLTLALFRIPTGMRAWIEDVVVDERARGRGAGAALTREAIRIAGECGARTVDLTSRPSREAANRMYRKLGFEPRETTVYRIES